eukprot:4881131-Amphidinium_carterae.1
MVCIKTLLQVGKSNGTDAVVAKQVQVWRAVLDPSALATLASSVGRLCRQGVGLATDATRNWQRGVG